MSDHTEIRILFVCLGNICRSPLAEGIFKQLIKERGVENRFIVDSAGTSGEHKGEDPDPRTIEIASLKNILLDHKARRFREEDLDYFDWIFAMDRSNMRNITKISAWKPAQRAKVHYMREFDPAGPGDVPDPYYGGSEGFEQVYQMLYRTCDNFLNNILPAGATKKM